MNTEQTDHIADPGKMINGMDIGNVKELIVKRFSTHVDSRCATEDEVWLAWLVSEHDRLTAANLSLTERVLYAERERDEAKGAWIPSAQPPTTSDPVLIWWETTSIMDKPRVFIGQYLHELKQWRPLGCNGNFNNQVTHWRPMPQPPKEAK